jgi:uncharacterized coiled-coil protein SlyX
MRNYDSRQIRRRRIFQSQMARLLALLLVFCGGSLQLLPAQTANQLPTQTTNQQDLAEKIQKLTDAMAKTQAQLEQSQRQLDEMHQELGELQRQFAKDGSSVAAPSSPNVAPPSVATGTSSSAAQTPPPATTAAIDDLRERQAVQESEIATQEQTKVESASKYPVKITGLLLMNGFVNTRQVDMAATPSVAVPGSGSTGASIRQTILGFDARGPHLFGARSYADLSVDFDGTSQPSSTSTAGYTGYYNSNTALLRLRTAHAGLQWQHTQANFSLDRPIFSPDSPTSLTAVAEPALAWSGNLWTWNPQVGVTQDIGLGRSTDLRLQAALMDVGDAPIAATSSTTTPTGTTPPNYAEQSRWPGVEARVALLGSKMEDGNHFGIGGYFAPHVDPLGDRYDAWAGTADANFVLPARLQFTSSFYRGAALGGLGGGGFKDFGFRADSTGNYYFLPLDDVGGWTQLKEKINERWQLNGAFGLDNVFASELRRYYVTNGTTYQNLARNRTYTGNVIFNPSAYLLFSLEYRHLESSPVKGTSSGSNVIGIAAGYKF